MLKKILWIFVEKGSVTIIQFLTLIILGRLLSPIDYGIYGTMMIFISIADMLVDSGFGGAIVQKKELLQEDINTIFVVNLALSIFLYVCLFILAPLLETYYSIDHLSLYFRIIGLSIIIYSLSIVQNSLLIRRMNFKQSAQIYFISTLLSSIIAIILAYYGFGIWSLIAQLLTNAIFLTVFLWGCSRIKVHFSFSFRSLRYFWRFGSNLVAGNILQTIVNNITTSIIPKIDNVTKAGYYFQSVKMNSIPVNILTLSIDKGVFPILSREPNDVAICRKSRPLNRSFLTLFTPIFPLLSISSRPLIKLLLGEKWLPAADYFSILLWSGIALMLQSLYRNIVKSIGDTKVILYVEIIKSIITLLVVVFAIKYGVMVLVIGYVASAYLGVIVWMIVLSIGYSYSFNNQIKDLLIPIVTSIFVYAICLIFKSADCSYTSFIVSVCGFFLYFLINYIIGNKELRHLMLMIRKKL